MSTTSSRPGVEGPRDLLAVFPDTAEVTQEGHLALGGCDLADLAREFDTPLYIFDEATLRGRCRSFRREFTSRHPQTQVLYASKAFLNRPLAAIFREEGLGLDVVSGGELAMARSVSFPMERAYFHGNNKSRQELEEAVAAGVGRVVVDNLYEISLLEEVAREAGVCQDIMLRLTPGVDPHTHAFTTTGLVDSKFGFPVGRAEEAVATALASDHLRPVGLHFHLGSPIYEVEPYEKALGLVLPLAARFRERLGFELEELSPGGGFAIQYTRDRPAPPVAAYAEGIIGALRQQCTALGLSLPRLVIEPGRAIVGPAGVALYRVGAIKEVPGVRKYVSVDGGMADNIRPALYGARYEAALANRMLAQGQEVVTVAGKFCESGDILIKDAGLPPLEPGDLLALPAAGAYCLSMASNYNASLKPAIVLVKEGKARLLRRRESYQDLMRNDVL